MGLFKRRALPPVEQLMAAAGLPTAGGAIPTDDLAMEVAQRGHGRITKVLAAVESILAGPEHLVALRFVEKLHNAVSHGTEGFLTTADLLPLRGPRTVEAWETVDRFYAAVVDWYDANRAELELSESLRGVGGSALRAILWPSFRSLADGRRVDVADVLRYELATGVTMLAFGPYRSR